MKPDYEACNLNVLFSTFCSNVRLHVVYNQLFQNLHLCKVHILQRWISVDACSFFAKYSGFNADPKGLMSL